MSQVHAKDATGLGALESAVGHLTRRGCLAVSSGVRPQPMVVVRKAGLDRKEGVVVRPTVAEALEAARSHLAPERA